MGKYIAAVDLGTKKITVVVGEKTPSGKIHVLAHQEAPSRGIVQGEVLNNVEVANVLKLLVEDLKQQSGIDITEIYAGVSGKHIWCSSENLKLTRNDPATEISGQEILRLEHDMYNTHVESGNKVLDVIPQIYHLDGGHSVTNPTGICSHRLEAEFCVLVGAESPMDLIRRSVQRVGLQLNGLFLSPLASAEAVLHDDDKNMGVAVVDIGGGTTDVVVYYDGIVRHVAVIPFGSDVITEDIQKGCAIPLRYAEQLKVQYGSCYSDLIRENLTFRVSCPNSNEVSLRMLTKIIEARMAEIIEAVEYIIQESGYAGRLSAGIVLTGGGAQLGELTEFVKYKTGMKARKGEPLFVTSESDAGVKYVDYATAVGLLMKGAADHEKIIMEKEPVAVEQEIFEFETVELPVGERKKNDKKNRIKRNIKDAIKFTGELFTGESLKDFFNVDNES